MTESGNLSVKITKSPDIPDNGALNGANQDEGFSPPQGAMLVTQICLS